MDSSGSLSSDSTALEDLAPVLRFLLGVPLAVDLRRVDVLAAAAPVEEDAPTVEGAWLLRSFA